MSLNINIEALLYLAASVCFILALNGLSSAKTAKTGNQFGMVGMAIAIGTTLLAPQVHTYGYIITAVIIGGVIGVGIAQRIEMTALPQLVAAFHSLVGLSAIFVAYAAYSAPESYGIGIIGNISKVSMLEMTLGIIIGAVTFTGSIIAFGKLQGIVSGKPLVFKGQHTMNAALAGAIFLMAVSFILTENHIAFWVVTFLSFLLGIMLILPIGGADMPVIVSMLNKKSVSSDSSASKTKFFASIYFFKA
jgi:NAD(P) transhydrogenase subunit beta